MTPDPALLALAARMEARRVAVRDAAVTIVNDQADLIVLRGEANCPVKSGVLRDSIHKVPVSASGGVVIVDVVADTPYALAVHERMPQEDHPNAEGTPEGHVGGGFLTRPLRFHQAEFLTRERVGTMKALREAA